MKKSKQAVRDRGDRAGTKGSTAGRQKKDNKTDSANRQQQNKNEDLSESMGSGKRQDDN